ncbi:MAG: hypothetical protein VX642_03955 [Bdellovibrionota bacterium]|nr:hypothetical protein [Bdellovibrionota bacterium]
MMKVFLIFAFLGLTPSLTWAQDGKFKYVMCRSKKIVRTIRVEWDPKEASCSTTYTKAGKDRIIGNGKFFDSCLNFLSNVQANLEKAGWSCKDISHASISEDEAAASEISSSNG